jgi:hypothetical protein
MISSDVMLVCKMHVTLNCVRTHISTKGNHSDIPAYARMKKFLHSTS